MRILALPVWFYVALAALAAVGGTQAQGGTLIAVTTTVDQYDADPASCALREAVVAANTDAAFGGCPAGSGADRITLPAGSYSLGGLTGSGEDAAAQGDLDISGTLTIAGAGAGTTTIDGAGAGDRVLQTLPSADLSIEELTIRGADVQTGTLGAGIYNQGVLTLSAVEVGPNSSASSGGGIYNAAVATLTLRRVRLAGNDVGSSLGGGLFNEGRANLRDVSVADNRAGGGAGLSNNGDAELTNVTISGNSAGVVGGAIYNSAALTLTNVTISGNSAMPASGYGGALFNTSTARTLLDSTTIYSNSGLIGGGIYNLAPRAAVGMRNSLLAGNLPQNCSGAVSSLGFNLDSGASCGFVAVRSNSPLELGPLADHGGFSPTHSLPIGSPAIDTGGGCPPFDQRGHMRPQGSACDVGAFERAVVSLPLVTR